MNTYLELTSPGSYPGTPASGSAQSPMGNAFFPESFSYPVPPQEMPPNFPCTFHQYSWLKSANPEFWWNMQGAGKSLIFSNIAKTRIKESRFSKVKLA